MAVYAAVTRVLRGEIKHRPMLSTWSAVLDYLRAAMAFEATEQFRLLFLDKRNFLLADEIHQTGTIDHTPVYPREVARRALEVGATAIIAVHNHPSGDPTPSQSDLAMTKVLAEALQPLGICDPLSSSSTGIVGRDVCVNTSAAYSEVSRCTGVFC